MRFTQNNRGSALVVAMIFAALIAIALTSYLSLSLNSMRLSQRSFYANAAMNLTDTGLETALWSLNNSSNWSGAGFSQVSGTTTQWEATLPSASSSYTFSQGVTGQVRIWVDLSNANLPHAVSKATVTLADGSTLSKEAEVYMQQRSYFGNGLVAKNSITFSGNNASVDGWNSNPTNTAGVNIPYTSSVANDGGQVGSTSVSVDSISVSNADIYGYAAIGSNSLSGLSVGPNGLVGPYGTANGTIDSARVTYDFTTSFPDVTAPTTSGYTLSAINNGGLTTLPRVGDAAAADGKYYYSIPSISLTGNGNELLISGGNVVINVTNTTGTTVSVAGQGSINIATGSSLALYTSGSVSIAGNGVSNGTYDASQAISSTNTPNQPSSFQVYGTLPASSTPPYQSISVTGNGILSGVVYAPNASISLTGGGSSGQVLGAMVGNSVSVTGNSVFHYDESLANLHTSNLWGLSKWRELTSSTDRATYATDLSF